MAMNVATMIGDVGTLVTQATDIITGNPALSALFGVGLVGAGAKLFKKLVHSSKNP